MKYGKNIIFDPELVDELNIDRQSLGFVPNGACVLDIGCATGFMGEYLINEKKCRVTGVEIGNEEASQARKKLNRVIVGDIEDDNVIKQLDKYDVVLASAVIEHLKDPWSALKEWKLLLKEKGFLIITTSSIAHWSARLKLLTGHFDYEPYGLFDNTHLRFFTTETFQQLIIGCGYEIMNYSIDPVGGGYPKISRLLSKLWPNLFAYQMVVKARPAREAKNHK